MKIPGRIRLTVVVAVFVVLAGCSGVPWSPTVTPSPTSGENTSALAPGLTESGVTDAWALTKAHRDHLTNTTYTKRSYRSIRANGTLLQNLSATMKRGHGGQYLYELHIGGTERNPTRAITVFRNDSMLVQRTAYENGTVVHVGAEKATTPGKERYGAVYSKLVASNTTVAETVERNGTRLYRVESVGEPDTSSAYTNASNYEFSALISPEGFVHEYHVSYATSRDGRPVTVTVSLQFTERGQTTVHPPAWASKA
ncbi:hypothetical protein [Haloarcula argentinensis]|uniref:Lipoprotein n=1 Tax=Haloarcula argentinensis TaxID=43776 RepID=A0A830FKA8_HALAR|nr:hypothetical protein [Haloarcula argentinensis]GGM45860.1 hypothetical protein GCM10009006_28940 [Haloarcula argentinensis]